jgi:hypothetical protein
MRPDTACSRPRLSARENYGAFAFVDDFVVRVVLYGPARVGDARVVGRQNCGL